MRHYDLSPSAAELYFNHSIFGQLYALAADALGRVSQGRPRARQQASAQRPRVPQRDPQAVRATPEVPRATLLDRLDGWFWRQLQNDRERFLARSRDVFELERRIAALERGVITRDY